MGSAFLHSIDELELSESSLTEPEMQARLDEVRRTALPREVCKGLIAKAKRLREIGFLPSTDPDAIERFVVERFQPYFQRDHSLPFSRKRELYRGIAPLLIYSDVARPNTLCDWSVTNVDEQHANMERLIAERYRDPESRYPLRHLHQGPGNNAETYAARKDSQTRFYAGAGNEGIPRNQCTEHIGIGDKLYLPLLLQQFAREPSEQGSPRIEQTEVQKVILRVLTEALQRKLHERWFSKGTTIDETWQQRVPICDLNVIFELLADPQYLLEGVYLRERIPKFSLSQEFQGDRRERAPSMTEREEVGFAAHEWLLRYTGDSSNVIKEELRNHKLRIVQRRFFQVDALIHRMTKAKRAQRYGHTNQSDLVALSVECGELVGRRFDATTSLDALLDAASRNRDVLLSERVELEQPIALSAEDTQVLRFRSINFVLDELGGYLESAIAPRRLLTEASQHLPPGTTSKTMTVKALTEALQKIEEESDRLVMHKSLTLEMSGQTESEITPEEKLLHAVFMRHREVPGAVLREVFSEEFVRGVEQAFSYTVFHQDYRKSKSFAGNRTLHVGPRTLKKNYMHQQIRKGSTVLVEGKHLPPDSSVELHGCNVALEGCDLRITGMPRAAFAVEVVSMLDLNEHPLMFPEGFVPGKFADLRQLFPDEAFMFISARRSQSHQTEEDFLQTIKDSLHLLAPGGCMETDGIRESYSRVLRLVGNRPDVRATVFLDRVTHEPVKLIVQRLHPNGYLEPGEMEKAVGGNSYAKTTEELDQLRPDIVIADTLRRELSELLARKIRRFQQFHPRLNAQHDPHRSAGPGVECLDRLLIRAGADATLRQHPEWVDAIFAADLMKRVEHRSQLAPSNPLEVHDLVGKSLWTIAAEVRTALQLPDTPATRDPLERAVADAIAYAQWRNRMNTTEGAPNAQQRTAIKAEYLDAARNIHYARRPLLQEHDIGYITERLRADITRSLSKTPKQ